MSTYLKDFWDKYGNGVLIVLVVILLATISFRVGQVEQEKKQSAKINISVVQKTKTDSAISESAKIIDAALKRKGVEVKPESEIKEISFKDTEQECVLIASKNSTKYHLPNCRNAARIKDSNRICFSSVEEAKTKGYEQAKCCHK